MIDADFTARLEEGERLLWTGGPAQGLLLTGRDWLLIPFGLFWCAMAVFILVAGMGDETPWPFLLVIFVFLVAGLFVVFGRFAIDAWLRRGIRYAVTSRRVLIERPPPFARSTSLRIAQLPQLDLMAHGNGRGTIRFGASTPYWNWFVWIPALDSVAQFLAVDDARNVFDLIEKAADASEAKA